MSERSFGVEQRRDGSIGVVRSDADLAAVTHPTRPLAVSERKQAASGWQRLRTSTAKSLHVWVVAATGADLVRTAAWMRGGHPFR